MLTSGGDFLIEFVPGQRSDSYSVFFDAKIENSAYCTVLMQRPNWKITRNLTEANLIFLHELTPMHLYRERSSNTTIFNHLPNTELLTNYYKLYQSTQLKLKFGLFKHFRLTYCIGKEAEKLIQHMAFIDYLVSAGNPDTFKMQITLKNQVENKKTNTQRSAAQMAQDQEKENDAIWGKPLFRPLCCSLNEPIMSFQRPKSGIPQKQTPLASRPLSSIENAKKRPTTASVPTPIQNVVPPPPAYLKAYVSSKQISQIIERKFEKPPEYSLTPLKTSSKNLWQLTTNPPVQIQCKEQIPKKGDLSHVYAIKECEFPVSFENRPLHFRVYALVLYAGDVYIYSDISIWMNPIPLGTMAQQALFDEQVFSLYNDQNYLSEQKFCSQLAQRVEDPQKHLQNIKNKLFACVKMFLGGAKQDLIKTAPCGGSFDLLAFDFQLDDKQNYQHLFIGSQTCPLLKLNSSHAYSQYPALIDDVFDLTIDKKFPSTKSQQVFGKTLVEQYRDTLLGKLENEQDLRKVYKQEQQIQNMDDEEIWKTIPKSKRKVEGLRWSGGRYTNKFFPIFKKWMELDK
ncbi:Tubulin_tyrosine ligase [Hexamita inflata]|uniref:Tubulin tyrosine ligase n=1 Tax=Hexamita inflata TaxID=28002 RepID=A0AA86VES8_9EUKA|nr:Tubulin tyrosine ligase [Hexamita inflata]